MVLLEGINPVLCSGCEKSVLAFLAFAFPPNALVFSSTFAYILLPFAYDTENLFINPSLLGRPETCVFPCVSGPVRACVLSVVEIWRLGTHETGSCRGRGGRRRRTAASLAVMGAGACLFAVAPPKCENNGSTKTVRTSITLYAGC